MNTPSPDSTDALDPAATRLHGESAASATTMEGQIGGFRLVRALGAGGMGTVYEAEEVATGRRVALKLISPQFAGSPDAVERFRQEGRLASGIVHPRCVFVLAADEDAGRPYIVMELMPGTTLKDVVDARGPMSVGEAVARICDVIDGLQQAHALSVIHRDVKPSNCFLDGDDRVKIGDFGLSKSLVGDVQLSQTGQFLGTLLFASPEQIRGESIDQQTDVYSVAATLYYLLTGHAPFEGGDAAATVARIAADEPKPLRSLRADIPQRVDAIVLRGLERNRQRRWRSLHEFREALAPYLPGGRPAARRGVRIAAWLLDTLLFLPLDVLNETLILAGWLGFASDAWQVRLVNAVVAHVPLLIYLTLAEGLCGYSLGKWLLRLRVIGPTGEPPGLARAAVRALVFIGLMYVPAAAIDVGYSAFALDEFRIWDALYFLAFVLGLVAVFSTARAGNGYRGLHEWASGTRVIALAWPVRDSILRTLAPSQNLQLSGIADNLPQRAGPYSIHGALAWNGNAGILIGEDTSLGRSVWIAVRSAGQPLSATRQRMTRPTRQRWLASGTLPDRAACWDAYVAPHGYPLTALAAQGLTFPWSDVRPILDQLTDELSAAAADGTFPDTLGPEQVWVHNDARVQLLDQPLDAARRSSVVPLSVSAEERALSLVRQVAVLMLGGRSSTASGVVAAPIPEHASTILSGLLSPHQPYQRLSDLKAQLETTRDRPTRVTTGMRAGHLAVLGTLLGAGLVMMFSLALGYNGLVLQVASEELAMLQHLEYLLEGERLKAYLSERWPAEKKVDANFATGGGVYGAVGPVEIERIFGEPEFQQSVRDRVAQRRRELERRLAQMSWVDRWMWRAEHEQAARLLQQQTDPPAADFMPEALVDAITSTTLPSIFLAAFLTAGMLLLVCSPPVIWMLWPLFMGPGLSYRIAGISLVRRDGRPAHRLQCAWRAVLIWAPVTALLASSIILQAASHDFILLATSLAWAALLMLIGYTLLALWFPTRSLHDVLAGTWLVPK